MSRQMQVQAMPDQAQVVPEVALISSRHQAALSELTSAVANEQTAVLLTGDSELEVSHVVGAFVAEMRVSAAVVRLRHPHPDALAAMREIVTGFGFDPKDLCFADLKNIVLMFLEYQRKHDLCAVICVEHAERQPSGVLSALAELIELGTTRGFRLMFAFSGGSGLLHLRGEAALAKVRQHFELTIRLRPYTLPQTREFLSQRSILSGCSDPLGLFEHDAVNRLHRLSGGDPDLVARLCKESLRTAQSGTQGPVSAKDVVKAARRIQVANGADTATAVVPIVPESAATQTSRETLSVSRHGTLLRELTLRQGRFMVGRAKSADICLPSSTVSRRHALIIRTATILQVLDLGSTNGTRVRGQKVREHTMVPNDVLIFGDFEVRYQLA
ncbi:MAG TPA: FHA domain-containing protein [Woeseiaceae bacterium]|nr:FHA domain-containing protein [Woeseiaceae bacterium]